MNKYFYLLSFCFLFSSCSSYTLYHGTEQKKTITDIPLYGSTDSVDVFFAADAPSAPYYKVQMIEAVDSVSYTTYDQLLVKLKEKAKAAGLDGVIIMDKQQNLHFDNDIYIVRQIASTYQQLSAVGIKYVNRINYMNSFVKSTMIDMYGNGEVKKMDFNFDYYGNLLNANGQHAREFYDSNILPFDVQKHLKGNVAYWQYARDEGNRIVSFRLTENDVVYVQADVDPFGSSVEMLIHYKILDPRTNKKSKFDLRCSFDADGRLKEKQLLRKNYVVWKETIEYADKAVTGFSRSSIENGQEHLLYKATNDFFSLKDLPKPLNGSVAENR